MAKAKETDKSEKQEAININGTKPTIPASELMKRMGVETGFFDPLPADQRKWQLTDEVHNSPIHRIWAWLVAHTVGNAACRREYAVNQHGHELHLEHIAADLGMDAANVRHYWRKGSGKIWRNGNKQEGERRLYLCGTVENVQEVLGNPDEGEEEANEKVCTYLLPSLISKKLKGWPSDKVAELAADWHVVEEADRELNSALMAARRKIIEQAQNTLLDLWGVKYDRQEHRKKGEGEEEAKERRGRIDPLMPALGDYLKGILAKTVQSREESLHGVEKTPHEVKTDSVQTSLYRNREYESIETRPNGRAESEPPARPRVVPQSPPHQNGNGKTDETWRPELREWLRENCPVKTVLDDVMFERIAFWLRPETITQFHEAALAVKNPRKWAIYEAVSKQVSERGEVISEVAVNRKDQRRQDWEREMYSKFGKEA